MIQDQSSLVGREPDVRFSVRGDVVAQGSMTAFAVPGKNGSRPRAMVTHGSHEKVARLTDWRRSIATQAQAAMGDRHPTLWPCSLEAVFTFPRLKAHLDSQGRPKAHAPAWKSTAPDIDKTARAVLDALTGIVYVDDSQVARLVVVKRYGAVPGVEVVIHYLGLDDQPCSGCP